MGKKFISFLIFLLQGCFNVGKKYLLLLIEEPRIENQLEKVVIDREKKE